MNKDRRKSIADLVNVLGGNGIVDLDALVSAITEVKDAEQEAFDNMPESFQEGERGQAAEQAIENLDMAADAVQTMLDSLNEAISYLEGAASN